MIDSRNHLAATNNKNFTIVHLQFIRLSEEHGVSPISNSLKPTSVCGSRRRRRRSFHECIRRSRSNIRTDYQILSQSVKQGTAAVFHQPTTPRPPEAIYAILVLTACRPADYGVCFQMPPFPRFERCSEKVRGKY